MRRRTLVLGAGGVAVVLVTAVLATWMLTRPADVVPVASIPVAVEADIPDGLTIGVVVSLSSTPGEGAEWKDAANGAVVAARRLDSGGHTVVLHAADDRGTVDGARAAVRELVDRGATGIVIATSGEHTSGAVEGARAAGVPVILPYVTDASLVGEGTWLSGPSSADIGSALSTTLGDPSRVLLVDAGWGPPADLTVAGSISFAVGGDPAALRDAITEQQQGRQLESILVSGPPGTQANAVKALQSIDSDLRVVVTPDALSPAFSDALSTAGGTLSFPLTTVGAGWGDAVALDAASAGRAMSAFLAGVKVVADDTAATTLVDDRPFSAVAAVADSRSHDAAMAIAHAAAAARSTDPRAIADALTRLSLGPSDGIAGPELDFADGTALSAPLTPLHSAHQNLGLRPLPPGTAPPLTWFAAGA